MKFGFTNTPNMSVEQQFQENEIRLQQISPLVQNIYSNSTLHFLGKGMDYIIEFGLYLLGLACIVFMFIMDTVFPFHVLGEIVNKQVFRTSMSNSGDLDTFHMAVKGLIGLIGILIILLGMMKNSARNKKSLLQQAGKVLKQNEIHFLELKKSLETQMSKISTVQEEHLTKLEAKPFPENL